ncbi:hypothetical protein D3C87_367480 [compost metagenome]
MRKFIPWIILFLLLLVAVPVLLNYQQLLPAKIIGVVLILLTTIALRVWLRRAIRKKMSQDAVKFNVNHRYYLAEISPIYKGMQGAEKKMLEKRMGKLLSDLQFDDTTRQELNVDDLLSYALIQVLAVYKEPYRSLKGKMIVFDQTNNSGGLKISQGKYVLVNPVLLEETLKSTQTSESFATSEVPIIAQLREFYLEA